MNRQSKDSSAQKRQVSAHLSDDLKTRYSTRSIPIRKGDSVRVLRGEFAGLEGKVDTIDRPTSRVFVEGMTREKTAGGGTSSRLSVHASKVLLTNLNLSDKWRSSLLEDKAKTARSRETEEGTA
jgi:large subunit ribosomal protein L24